MRRIPVRGGRGHDGTIEENGAGTKDSYRYTVCATWCKKTYYVHVARATGKLTPSGGASAAGSSTRRR